MAPTTNANDESPKKTSRKKALPLQQNRAEVAEAAADAAVAAAATIPPTLDVKSELGLIPPSSTNRRSSSSTTTRIAANASWNDMLFHYISFQTKHELFDKSKPIPRMSNKLAEWVRSQKQQYNALLQTSNRTTTEDNNNDDNDEVVQVDAKDVWKLTEERTEVLQFVGFSWKNVKPQVVEYNKLWNQRFEELQQFKQVNGHCNVPQGQGPLGKWVKIQRDAKKEADHRAAGGSKKASVCLSQDRMDKLESVGFEWRRQRPNMPNWEDRYQQLIDYKLQNGDTLVPQSYPPDKTFGKWIMKQRCEYSQLQRGKKSTMTDERMQKLNDIGFYWVSPRFKRKREADPTTIATTTEEVAAAAAAPPQEQEEQPPQEEQQQQHTTTASIYEQSPYNDAFEA